MFLKWCTISVLIIAIALPLASHYLTHPPANLWQLELTLISAKDLDIRRGSNCPVYVVVSMKDCPLSYRSSPSVTASGKNPTWEPFTFHFNFPVKGIGEKTLRFVLRCEREGNGDEDVGKVEVPVSELFGGGGVGRSSERWQQMAGVEVVNGDGEIRGLLTFEYRIHSYSLNLGMFVLGGLVFLACLFCSWLFPSLLKFISELFA